MIKGENKKNPNFAPFGWSILLVSIELFLLGERSNFDFGSFRVLESVRLLNLGVIASFCGYFFWVQVVLIRRFYGSASKVGILRYILGRNSD